MRKLLSPIAAVLMMIGLSAAAPAAAGRHALWNDILRRNVVEDGWVDYRAIGAARTDELDRYLAVLARTSPADLETENERKAFWINAYNAVTIAKLLDAGLPASVPHAPILGKNIFKERTYRVAGRVRSLDDIEHGILRERFADNRVHAALVCGASSCPRLRPEAYEASRLDAQLDEEAQRWVQSGRDLSGRRKNRLDREAGVYHVSKIFDWFDEDFGADDAGILAFLAEHGTESDRAFLATHRVRIRYLPYDWSLNRRPDTSDRF